MVFVHLTWICLNQNYLKLPGLFAQRVSGTIDKEAKKLLMTIDSTEYATLIENSGV